MSVGRRGLWFTVGPRGTRESVGLPGTGLSYVERQRIGTSPVDGGEPATASGGSSALVWLPLLAMAVLAIAIFA